MSKNGFVIQNELSEKPQKSSSFAAVDLDFVDSKKSSSVDFAMWSAAHTEIQEDNTLRCMATSLLLHASLFLAAALVTVPMLEKAKTETITIELADQSGPIAIPDGKPVVETKGKDASPELSAREQLASSVASKDDVVVQAMPRLKQQTKTARRAAPAMKKIKVVRMTRSAQPARAMSMPKFNIPKAPAIPVPETLDDIAAPTLDDNGVPVNVAAGFDDRELSDDFKKVDKHQKKQIMAMKKAMDQETEAFDQENSSELAALDAEAKAEAAKLAAINKAQQEKEAKALAAAAAAEEAAQREASLRAARAARLANARNTYAQGNALRTGNGRSGSGTGEEGMGTGKAGAIGPTKMIAGIPGGVRSLEQLRQMPGNPRPRYDQQERFHRHQGEVSYVAYVTKEGIPTQFKMLKSTGFQNLDAKTLAALQKWKFYPGQEGWVELPIKWDLEGGAQEMHARLRTRVSKN